ncbi:MAG: restriction endonuclease subunit S [Gallionella sp.]
MKDSGVAWVGVIPHQWSVVRGKDMLLERTELSKYGDEELLSVSTYTGIKPRRDMIDADDSLSRADSLVGYKICYSGDIVINTMLAWNGSIGLSNYAGIVSPAYAVYKLRKEFAPKFVEYLLRSEATLIKIRAESRGINDARLRLYPDSLFAIQFGAPSYLEQRAIADYLDQQTALIDQRLSTLEEKKTVLAELRKATIHEAVTKGLNKNASMKDSGVAWIGEIPQGWQPSPFKDNLLFMSRGVQPIYANDTDFFVTNQACLSTYQMRQEKKKECEPLTGERGRYKCGDVLVASTGEGVLGKCVLSEEVSYCDSHVSILRAKNAATGKFIFYWLSANYETVNSIFAKGSTKQTELQKEAFLAFKIGFPPLDEQLDIASHLDQQTQQIDAQLATLDEQAQVLKELRKAIIHVAVTGKNELPSPAGGRRAGDEGR